MQVVYRYRIQRHRFDEYARWLEDNREALDTKAREGWRYLGTWFVLQNLGDYDAETRWELEDYSAFGSGFGDEETQRLILEMIDFTDPSTPIVGVPLKELGEVTALPGS